MNSQANFFMDQRNNLGRSHSSDY